MTQTNYENIVIPCPALQEQVNIYQFIDQKCAEIDAVLAKIRTSIEEHKKLKQAIITQAVTKGVRGDRPMKRSGIEWIPMIPADWSSFRGKHLFYENNLDYLCKALKNRHFRGYGQPNLLPIYYFCGKSLDMRSTARASRPDGAAHR